MTTTGLCGQPIVHRHDDGSITFTPCARKPGHQGRHRDADFMAREKDRVNAKYDAMTPEERAEFNRKRNRKRRPKLPAGTNSYSAPVAGNRLPGFCAVRLCGCSYQVTCLQASLSLGGQKSHTIFLPQMAQTLVAPSCRRLSRDTGVPSAQTVRSMTSKIRCGGAM